MTGDSSEHGAPVSSLDEAFSALIDGTLPVDDQDRLEERLIRDDRARARYRDFMRMECLLAWEILYGAIAPPAVSVEADVSEPSQAELLRPGPQTAAPPQTRPRRRQWAILSLGVALAAALLVLAPAMFRHNRNDKVAAAAATLTASRDAQWQGPAAPVAGAVLPFGPLRLIAGTAQISFGGGAIVTLHGPAQVEVLDGNRLFLRAGRITSFVPPNARGFTVVSPSGEVVDFGTEFAMGVTADGKTDVFVIDGRVDVKGGHKVEESPAVKLTQGYATRFSAADHSPTTTLSPLFIDHFDGGPGGLTRTDVDPSQSSFVRGGTLWLPIDGRSDRGRPVVRTVITNDLTMLRGRRAVISFKVTFPENDAVLPSRWLALAVDDAADLAQPPYAWDERAALAVLMSPGWQVGARFSGEVGYLQPVFSRHKDAVGPYQVVVSIDDSPAAHARHRGTTTTVMVNGLEVITDRMIEISGPPRLSLQTFPGRTAGNDRGSGHAIVDDFSVSVEAERAERP